jgi:hypothetical protein
VDLESQKNKTKQQLAIIVIEIGNAKTHRKGTSPAREIRSPQNMPSRCDGESLLAPIGEKRQQSFLNSVETHLL